MRDSYSRKINYLKISLTEKCNLRCVYCKDEDDNNEENVIEDTISVEDFKFLIKNFAQLGINKIKFVGGEPLLYPYLKELIHFAKYECNMKDVSITTNGQNFCENAIDLKESGLDRVNISIDSLKEYRYKGVTRGASLSEVLNTLNTCLRLKLPVKINCVLIDEFNTDEIYDFITLSKYNNVDLRFVELSPYGKNKDFYKDHYANVEELVENLDIVNKDDYEIESNTKYYNIKNLKGRAGIICPSRPNFCDNCNKIMITHDGFIRLCFFADEEIDLKNFLHKPIMFREAIKEIITEKQKSHTLV